MATNGQLIRKLAEGKEPLLEAEIQQLERAFDDTDNSSRVVNGVALPDSSFQFDKLLAREADFDIPVTRGITYSFITNGTIPTGTYTDLIFSGSRGYIKESDACVLMASNGKDFSRNPRIPKNRSIFAIAEVTWDYNVIGVFSYFDVSIDSYYDGGYQGSYFNHGTGTNGYLSQFVMMHDSMFDDEYVRLNVYQDLVANLDITSCNLTFFLA